MSAAKKVAVRILADVNVGTKSYKPNQLVAFSPAQAKALVKSGHADDAREAVEYCLGQGVEGVEHDANDEPAGGELQPESK
jgi:hypothetical protein